MGEVLEEVPRASRVVVGDDHPLVGEFIRMACAGRADLMVVAQATTASEAVRRCRDLRPEVLILELRLCAGRLGEVLTELRDHAPGTRVLLTGSVLDGPLLMDALRLGIQGFVEKSRSPREVIQAIESVAAGGTSFGLDHRRFLRAELGVRARRSAVRASIGLTPREREVLNALGEGITSREVAVRLGVSGRTVETHCANLYRKLGARNRVQALREAAVLGLIELGPSMTAVADGA